jgi:FKBP-type peptidyl-prolyl cis-trans isomerase
MQARPGDRIPFSMRAGPISGVAGVGTPIEGQAMSERMPDGALKVEDLTEGSGTLAERGHRVEVHFAGRLSDGCHLDCSREQGETFRFRLGAGRVSRGWDQGIRAMRVGDIRRLSISPHLGYRAVGAGGVIPPEAMLVFAVELISVG